MLRFHQGWGHFLTADGGEVWSLTTNRRFGVRADRGAVATIFKALDEGVDDIAVVRERFGPAAAELIDGLSRVGAVIDDAGQRPIPDSDDIYVHQREFFALWETPETSGDDFQRKLRDSSVLIVGVGAFGSWIALNCARIGIGRIELVDPDVVEATNLPRQILYRASDVGRPKVEAAADALRTADPDIDVRTHQFRVHNDADLHDLTRGVDLVFNAFGYRVTTVRDLIATACVRTGTPSLLSGGSTLGPLCVPGQDACVSCMADGNAALSEAIDTMAANEWLPPRTPFAPIISAMSALAVWEAAKFLTGCAPPMTANAIWSVDLFGLEFSRVEGRRRPGCPTCGEANVA